MNTKFISSALLSLLLSLSVNAQQGAWTGDLSAQGMKIPLVFNFSDNGCTLDSPIQGVKGLKTEWTREENGNVVVNIPTIGGIYKGTYDGKEITGSFSQRGMTFPLNLTPKKVVRPQTPVAPFPYTTEEVSFTNGDAVLKGTLTLPEGYNKNTPVLVMVTGSGLQNRDEELYDHKPFAVIADALARNGIATLRYDDRGFGESTGDVTNCTTEDLKNDALAGVTLMRKRFAKVGIIGHSEGGTIGFMLANQKKVDFVVSLAGCATSSKEAMLWQNKQAFTNANVPAEMVSAYCSALETGYNDLIAGKKAEDISTDNVPEALKDNFKMAMKQGSTPYFRYFISIDESKNIANIKCPVLGLNGKLDKQVDYESNLAILSRDLKNKKSKTIAFDGLNHLFQHCKTGFVYEYGEIEETISPDVLIQITDWIKSLF